MGKETLRGKTALITGSAKRLGKAVALALAEQGVNVVIHYNKSEEKARQLQAEISGLGVKSWASQADFSNQKGYEKLIKEAKEHAGHLDILINNASIFPKSSLFNLTLDELNESLKINAWAPFILAREFARRVQKGKIINFLDTRITGYVKEHVAYYLSKKLLATLTRMCALQFAPHITVNGIAPGLILPPEGKGKDYLAQKSGQVPLKTHGDPTDITQAVLYLLNNTFITGQIIYIDGGQHLAYDYG